MSQVKYVMLVMIIDVISAVERLTAVLEPLSLTAGADGKDGGKSNI